MRAQSLPHQLIRDRRRSGRRSTAARVGTRMGMWLLVVTGALLSGGCDTPTGVEHDGDAGAVALDPITSGVTGPPEGVTLPWHMQYQVALVGDVVPPTSGCLFEHDVVIEGEATHLGKLSGTGITCVTNAVVPDPDPPFVPSGSPPYVRLELTNQWTLTASNGDELWIEGNAVSVISLVDGSTHLEGSSAFVGGTGRFGSATGESADVSAEGVSESTGWIHFHASGRAGN